MAIYMTTVTIYTKPTCPFCIAAKALLKRKGVAFNEISIEGDRDAAISLAGRTGRGTVPQIFVGTEHIGGYDDLEAFENAGNLDAFPSRLTQRG
jgi:glutaredoxin 3